MALSRPVKLALGMFCLPFFIAGILLAGSAATWITGSSNEHTSVWFLLVFPCLLPIGVVLGALIAYGIIVFFVGWISPSSPLLVESEEASGAVIRLLWPAFRRVKALALWLTPKHS
jgi:hypothetical protein